MKLKYQISEISDLQPQFLINKILRDLEKNRYYIINRTNNTIKFTRDQSLFSLRSDSLSKVDEGIFEVCEIDGVIILSLTYNQSYLAELIVITLLILFGFLIDNAIFIFPIALAIIFIARVATLRNISRNLLRKMNTKDKLIL